MSEPNERTVTHPVFGELRWTKESGCWTGRVADSSGGWFDVIVADDDGTRESLDRAAVLYQKAIRSERRILRAALREEVLELYNESWSGEGDDLSENELLGRLHLELVDVSPGGYSTVEFHYDGTELFGGHVLVIELDENLKYRDYDLRG